MADADAWTKCVLCGSERIKDTTPFNINAAYISCPNCGDYKTKRFYRDVEEMLIRARLLDKRYILSGYFRELKNAGQEAPVVFTAEQAIKYLSLAHPPQTLMESMERLLLHLYHKNERLFDRIGRPSPAEVYARDSEDISQLIQALSEIGWLYRIPGPKLERGPTLPSPGSTLTLQGIQHAESLSREQQNSTRCFVAMCFNDEMLDIYAKHIKPAMGEVNYDAVIISEKHHNGDICDHIIAEIRRSRFIIADFTENRDGVYYEAGFARGLGLEVIHTCKQSYFEIKDEQHKMHFDVEHNNFILWKDGLELAEKLKDRVRATILPTR